MRFQFKGKRKHKDLWIVIIIITILLLYTYYEANFGKKRRLQQSESPDFVNVSPKNHLQIMGRYVDVVS